LRPCSVGILLLSLFLRKKTYSTKSRPPAFYDKHFDHRLILQRVKRLPSLVQALATNVDRKLSAASTTLPSQALDMPASRRKVDRKAIPRVAPDETAVANYYDKTTAMYCPPIASTLVLHPKASTSEWLSLLSWTQSGSSSGHTIMDGQLQINDEVIVFEENKAQLRGILASMDPVALQMYEKMKGPPLMPLATWGFKSLTTGSEFRYRNECSW